MLANAIAGGTGEERREVVVDAAGYRDRRRRTLEALALRSAEEAVRTGSRVELEPMSAAERKIVHTSLQDARGRDDGERGRGAQPPRRRRAGLLTRRLEAWLRAVVETPGLTALDLDAARRALLEDALRAVPLVERARGPDRRRRLGQRLAGDPARARAAPAARSSCSRQSAAAASSCERWAPPNARVVRGRAEEQETDWAGAALAKALAPPPVAAEWCLPLVRPGGAALLWVGESADLDELAGSRRQLAAEPAESPRGSRAARKIGPDAAGFPAPRRGSPASARCVTAPSASDYPPGVAGRVYAFANQKGGVGKTTTTVNLAACLAEAGERALVVDLDPQANATSGLGMHANGTSSYDLLDGVPRRGAREADGVPEPLRDPVQARARGRGGRAVAPLRRRELPRLVAGRRCRGSTSSCSTARPRSAR